jgi:Spy/CpxP family protein refolding chaperone
MRFIRVWLSAACVASALALGVSTLDVASASAAQRKPKNATAQCVDGTYSMAKSQQGACSSHGGVKTWYGGTETKAEAKVPKTETKAATKETRTQAKTERKVAPTEAKADRKVDRTENKISPRRGGTPADATARCNDGTYSYAAQHSGACSSHGGVAEWYR